MPHSDRSDCLQQSLQQSPNFLCSSVRTAAAGFALSTCAIGSITFVFAPQLLRFTKMLETAKIQLQNYGAKDMVHNKHIVLVFAP
jgi:hypothetical protein